MTEPLLSLIRSDQSIQIMQETLEKWKINQPVDLDWVKILASFSISTNKLRANLETLCLINCFQWYLEDECRLNYGNLIVLGKLKILIDESNSRRITTVFNIDSALVEILYRNHCNIQSKRPIGESVGYIYDRLTIMYIKSQYLQQNGDCDRFILLNEQIKDTFVYLDEILNELASYNRILKLYLSEKIYKATVFEYV